MKLNASRRSGARGDTRCRARTAGSSFRNRTSSAPSLNAASASPGSRRSAVSSARVARAGSPARSNSQPARVHLPARSHAWAASAWRSALSRMSAAHPCRPCSASWAVTTRVSPESTASSLAADSASASSPARNARIERSHGVASPQRLRGRASPVARSLEQGARSPGIAASAAEARRFEDALLAYEFEDVGVDARKSVPPGGGRPSRATAPTKSASESFRRSDGCPRVWRWRLAS